MEMRTSSADERQGNCASTPVTSCIFTDQTLHIMEQTCPSMKFALKRHMSSARRTFLMHRLTWTSNSQENSNINLSHMRFHRKFTFHPIASFCLSDRLPGHCFGLLSLLRPDLTHFYLCAINSYFVVFVRNGLLTSNCQKSHTLEFALHSPLLCAHCTTPAS